MRISRDDRAGLYITVIVHLVVLIVLMVIQLGATWKKESSFVLDFTKMEQIEKLQKELELKQAINDRLNEMLAGGYEPIRNIAVDRSELRDDRHSAEDARELYEEAEKLKQDLQRPAEKVQVEHEIIAAPTPSKKEEAKKEVKYSGPSVLEYVLEGRKASRLPIPAYRCIGAGEVRINITVDKQGTVVGAKVDESSSSSDGCLRSFAVRAARMSKFSMSTTAPDRQTGYIIYQFVAQ
ncbi:MAG: energy transducer TonB [Bacteroidales bacterium]|nr:energy transducer TonB [Bacteroidales bacterium]